MAFRWPVRRRWDFIFVLAGPAREGAASVMCSRFHSLGKLKSGGREDLPYRLSSAGVLYCTLRFDVEVHHDTAPQLRHFADTEADRNSTPVIAVIDIPDA